MTITELQEKLDAAEQKVEKCKKTIERHKAQMEKKAKQLRDMGVDPETADKYSFVQNGANMNRDIYWLLCDYEGKMSDIKGATQKLEAAEKVLENWQHKLDLQINMEKVINETVPDVLKDFLERWKGNAYAWYIQAHAGFVKFKAQLRKEEREARLEAFTTLPEYAESRERHKKIYGEEEPSDHSLHNVWPRQPMENFLKERDLDYKSIRERLAAQSDSVILKMCEFPDDEERYAWLDKILEEERKAKLMDLYGRVTAICGSVVDVDGLRIDESGDLGGVIFGEKGVASLRTIGAGGYNIQCYHYRTLIKDITEKVKVQPRVSSLDNQIADAKGKIGSVEKSLGKESKDMSL